MQVATTITSHEPKQIEGRNGSFTMHLFKTADGGRLQTTKGEKANELYGLAFTDGQPNNAPVTVTYEESQRGRYTNFDIVSSVAGHVPGAATSLPKSSSGGGGGRGGYTPKDQAVINRSAALSRAIETVAAGIVSIEELGGSAGLFKLADSYVKYIEGPKQAEAPAANAAPTAAAPAAAAPEAAPTAAAPAAAPTSSDDDIPF